jgi:hypothetical protein
MRRVEVLEWEREEERERKRQRGMCFLGVVSSLIIS